MNKKEIILKVEQFIRSLSVEIGARPAASDNHQKAVALIDSEFKAAGLNTQVLEYPCPEWHFEEVSLSDDKKNYSAIPNIYTLPCEICSEYVAAFSMEELKELALEKKILILGGELTKKTFIARNFDIFKEDYQEEILDFLEKNKPSAIIAISHEEDYVMPLFEDSDFKIPSVTVSKTVGENILNAGSSKLTLKIKSCLREGKSGNVIAQTNQNIEERMIICGHFDTKFFTPGAIDNATGTATLLVLSQILSELELKKQVEFVAFGSEDTFFPGDRTYFEREAFESEKIKLAVNIDSVIMKGEENSVIFLCEDETINQKMRTIKDNTPEIKEVPPYFEGDHAFFAMRGISVVSLSSTNVHDYIDRVIHTENDTMEKTEPERIMEVIEFIVNLIRAFDSD